MDAATARNTAAALATSAFRRPGLTPPTQALSKVAKSVGDDLQTQERQAGAACQKGCCHCCYRPIPVSNIEAANIAATILDEWPEAKRAELKTKLDKYQEEARFQRANPLEAIRTQCPFLENDECSIYDFRPWVCRGQASTNVEA